MAKASMPLVRWRQQDVQRSSLTSREMEIRKLSPSPSLHSPGDIQIERTSRYQLTLQITTRAMRDLELQPGTERPAHRPTSKSKTRGQGLTL